MKEHGMKDMKYLVLVALVAMTGCQKKTETTSEKDSGVPALKPADTKVVGLQNDGGSPCALRPGMPHPDEGSGACRGNKAVVIEMPLMPFEARITYNSSSSSNVGFGLGWSSSINLRLEVSGQNLNVTLGDGTVVSVPQSGGKYLSRDPRFENVLIEPQGNNFVATFSNGNRYLFTKLEEQTHWVLKSTSDPTGATIEFDWPTSSEGTLNVKFPNGRTAILQMNGGRVASISNGLGLRYDLTYDGSGRLTRFKYPTGQSESFTYLSNGLMASHTNVEAQTTTFTYDSLRRISRETNAFGYQTAYTYTSTSVIVGDQFSFLKEWFAGGKVMSMESDQKSAQYERDDQGRMIGITDQLGLKTSFEYDTNSRVTKVTDPAGVVRTIEYDAFGRVTKVTTSSGEARKIVKENVYNSAGLLLSALTDGEGRVYEYDQNNRIAKMKLADGTEIVSFEYDSGGRLAKKKDRFGLVTTYQYDEKGRLTELTDPLGLSSKYTWDDRNQIIKVDGPDGGVIEYTQATNGLSTSEKKSRGEVELIQTSAVEIGSDGIRRSAAETFTVNGTEILSSGEHFGAGKASTDVVRSVIKSPATNKEPLETYNNRGNLQNTKLNVVLP